MSLSKLNILKHFLCFRWSRRMHAGGPSKRTQRNWKKGLRKSKFYQPFLDSEQSFPIIDKTMFMENFDEINTVGISKSEAFSIAEQAERSRDFSPTINGVSVGLSSGTSGNKGIFLTSPSEREMWVGAVLDRVIGFSLKKRKVAFFLRANNTLYESVQSRSLSFSFFDLTIPIEDHFPKIKSLNATILVAPPSVLVRIAERYQAEKLSASFKKIIAVAEVLDDDQKSLIEQVFNQRVEQVYQCTEGFLAHTCKKGKLHFNEDWLKIEKKYIDNEQKRYHPIITDYLRTSQPVVRYLLNDIIHEGKPCSCGMKSTVIERIEGRADDIFRFDRQGRQIEIFPDFVRRAVITTSDKILDYKVVQQSQHTIGVWLQIDPSATHEEQYHDCFSALQGMLRSFGVFDVELKRLEREVNFENKLIRVKNECN